MGRSGLVSLPLARLEKTFKMVVKISLIASFAAVLIICATAELPTEENNVLDSEVGLDSINTVVGLEENTAEEEDLRQKREAIPDQKKGKGNGKGKEKRKPGKEKGNLGMVKGKEKGKPGKEKGRNLEMVKEKGKLGKEKGRNQGMGKKKEKEKGRKQGKGKEKLKVKTET